MTQETLRSGRKGPQVLHPSSAPDSVAAMQGGSERGGARWRPPRADSPPRLHRSWGPRLERSDGGQVGTELESFQSGSGNDCAVTQRRDSMGGSGGSASPESPPALILSLGQGKTYHPELKLGASESPRGLKGRLSRRRFPARRNLVREPIALNSQLA